jgi:hypothetical protein
MRKRNGVWSPPITNRLGVVGQQVQFKMSSSLDEVVHVAIKVGNAECMRQSDTKRVFSAKREGSFNGNGRAKTQNMGGVGGRRQVRPVMC